MIQKLRKFLGLETEEEKMQDLLEINKSLIDLHKSIEEVADDFTSKNEGYKELLKSENLTEEFKKSIQQRHKFLIEDQKEEIQTLIKQRNKLREEHKSLMKNEKIFKAVSEISFYDTLKAKYKANELTPKQYDIILKAKQGKVLYADNIVFNEKGQILLLQRTRVEDDKNGGKWVIPGGHVDAGEEFCEAALRELQEESGITINDCEEVGIFEDNGVEIHYFESIVKEKDVQIILQDKESESFTWTYIDELDKYDMPFNMAENILNLYPHCKEEVLNISKAVKGGRLSQEFGNDLIEKARSGIYQNTAENRKKGIVGAKYGSTKPTEPEKDKSTSNKISGLKDTNYSKMEREEFEEVFDNSPLKEGESYFLRFTENPLVDFKRKTSVHYTNYSSIKEAKEGDNSKEYIKLKDGLIGEKLDGLAAFELDSQDFEDINEEIEELIKNKSNGSNANAGIFYNRIPVLYKGKYTDSIPDGVSFQPTSIVRRFGYDEMIKDYNSRNSIEKSLESFLNNGSISEELFEKAKRTGVYTDMAENILNLYPHRKEEVLNISKAVENGRLSKEFGNDLIEKARSGIYQNTAENRKKGIVGAKYGSTKPTKPEKVNKRIEREVEDKTKLGRSDKFIEKTKVNHKNVLKAVEKHLDSIGQKNYTSHARTTSSSYMETEDKEGNDFKIRFSNHSPALSDMSTWEGLKVSLNNDNSVSAEIDMSVGYSSKDILEIIDTVGEISKEIKKNPIKFSNEELFEGRRLSKEVGDKIIESKIKELSIKEDSFGILKDIIVGEYGHQYRHNEDFKKYKESHPETIEENKRKQSEEEEKKKKEVNESLPIYQYKASNGVLIQTGSKRDSSKWQPMMGHLQEYSGKENKSKRQELGEQAIKELEEKIKNGDFDKIEKGNFEFDLIKAFELGQISEELFEKAKRTGVYTDTAENRKLKRVGQKYSKEKSGEVSTEKEGKKEDSSNKETKDQPIEEHAKQASETALQNASKSGDEELRIAAKKELERRETEHQPEGEKEQPSDKKSETDTSSDKKEEGVSENEHIEKFRTLSDEQVKFYLDAPYPKVKEAAQAVADERGLKVISKEDYIKGFEDLSKATPKKQRDFYVKEGEGASTYLRSNEEINKSVSYYRQNGYIQIRRLLIDENKYKESLEGKVRNVDQSLEISKKGVENISKFISDNRIQKDISLNRRVLTGDTFFTKLKEGDIYEDKSFSSTSLGELEQFGDFNIKILAKKGSSVANLDNFAEKEYLIDKGVKFRVLETKDNGITVELL